MLASSSSMSSFEGIVTAARPFIVSNSASTPSLIQLTAASAATSARAIEAVSSSRYASKARAKARATTTKKAVAMTNHPSSMMMQTVRKGAAFVPPHSGPRHQQQPLQSIEPQLIQHSFFSPSSSVIDFPFEQTLDSDTIYAPGLDVSKLIPKSNSLRATLNVDDEPKCNEYSAKFHNQRKPWIVGHRGAVYHQVENTRESFLKSYELGSDAVELDLFLLPKDNTLVCYHGSGSDATPGGLSNYFILEDVENNIQSEINSSGGVCSTSILDLNYDQTQKLNFNPFHEEFPCDPSVISKGKIPKLEQILLDAKRLGKQVKIELKGPGTVEPVLELVEKLGIVNQCQFSSFNHDLLALLRKLRPEQEEQQEEIPDNTCTWEHPSFIYKTGALFNVPVPTDFIQQAKKIGASEVHLRYDVCTKDRVQAIHDAGLRSMAWFRGPIGMKEGAEQFWDVGNEDEAMYQAVLDTGVQQMCVNKPDVLSSMVMNQHLHAQIHSNIATRKMKIQAKEKIASLIA